MYASFSVGEEVKVGDEKFFVIKDSGTNESSVRLLAETRINANTQSSSAEGVSFSAANSLINEYIASLGLENVTGRLMTKQEVEAICGVSSLSSGILPESTPTWVYSTTYWLGPAIDNSSAWRINDTGNLWNVNFEGNFYGVRPVLEISKDKVTKLSGS